MTAQPPHDDLTKALKAHIHVLVAGICGTCPHVPPHQMMPALAAAFGMVMSDASRFPDITFTLNSRNAMKKAFNDALNSHAPALTAVPAEGQKAS